MQVKFPNSVPNGIHCVRNQKLALNASNSTAFSSLGGEESSKLINNLEVEALGSKNPRVKIENSRKLAQNTSHSALFASLSRRLDIPINFKSMFLRTFELKIK